MIKRCSRAMGLATAGAILLVPLGNAAVAAPRAGGTTISTSTEDGILWVEVSVPDLAADQLKVDIRAPRAQAKGRELFQRCLFPYAGAGTYRCGVDVASVSKSIHRGDTLLVVAFIDGDRAAKKVVKP